MTNSRRDFLKDSMTAAAGFALAGCATSGQAFAQDKAPSDAEQWPDGIRLMVSVSMQFEAGGQPSHAESPFSGNPLPKNVPDLPAETWFEYGYKEGIPRLLDLWDEHKIKVTSHMVGKAVERNPDLAKEIVQRGHEAAAHGMTWADQHSMSRADELAFVKAGVEAVEKATGRRPIGYNCNWLRRSVNTLSVLQELGFLYHIDDVSRDEPFTVPVDGKDFVVVPYTLRTNDIVQIAGRGLTADQFGRQLRRSFDRLYKEARHKRRLFSLSTHDRIAGAPEVVDVLDEFLTYVKTKAGVAFWRKDQIARYAANSKFTIREGRTK